MSPKIFKDFFLSSAKKKKKVVKYEKSNYAPLALTLRRDAKCALPGLGNCRFLALPCAWRTQSQPLLPSPFPVSWSHRSI